MKTQRFIPRAVRHRLTGAVTLEKAILLAIAVVAVPGFTALGFAARSAIAGQAVGDAPQVARGLSPQPAPLSAPLSAQAGVGGVIRELLEAAENLPEDMIRKVEPVDNEFWVPPERLPVTSFDDVAGIDDIVRDVWEIAVMPFQKERIYEGTSTLAPPRGILLEGPPGVGKTQLARAVATIAGKYGVAFFDVDTAQLASDLVKGPARVAELFNAARQQPSIIFLDEFDAVAKARGKGGVGEAALTTLLRELDGMRADDKFVVMSATNLAATLDEAIKRPGRFDRVISVPVPNAEGRATLFDLFTRTLPVRIDVPFDDLVTKTEGFTGADIRGVVQEARLRALRRTDYDEDFVMIPEDFTSAVDEFNPTVARSDLAQASPVRWEDVGGLREVIEKLVDGIEAPWRNPERFTATGEKATPLNFLLFGPPGTGKTLLAQAVATEVDAPVFIVRGSDVNTMWYGESSRNLRKILDKAARSDKAIVYFDEAESLFPRRGGGLGTSTDVENDRVVNELLQFMDGAQKNPNVSVIFGTNRPELMDDALLSRVDDHLYVGVPDLVGRREIIDTHLRGRKLAVDDEIAFKNELAARTEGYVGRDLARLIKRAARRAATHGDPDRPGIDAASMEWALEGTRRSVSDELDAEYKAKLEQLRNRD